MRESSLFIPLLKSLTVHKLRIPIMNWENVTFRPLFLLSFPKYTTVL